MGDNPLPSIDEAAAITAYPSSLSGTEELPTFTINNYVACRFLQRAAPTWKPATVRRTLA